MATVYKRGGTGNRGGRYYIAYFDHRGKRLARSARTTDRATAERIAAKMEADAALRREGVIDPTLDGISRESRRTIESHLADYEAKFWTADRSDDHVKRTLRSIRWICKNAGFVLATDISADGVTRAAGQLKKKGRSARTIQAYLTAIKGFTRWLAENHKLPRDPLSSVRKPNPKADRRRERRMPLPEEWKCLEASVNLGPVRYEMAPAERVLLYNTAIQTGLRSAELRSLTRGRLFLDEELPFIICKAGSAKNRKDARQYIEPELVAALRAHVAQKTPAAPVFNMPHETNVARMLRADLAAARAQWLKDAADDPAEFARRQGSDFLLETNGEGEVLDFHSLRHTCGAWLAMTGAHPKIVQTWGSRWRWPNSWTRGTPHCTRRR
jgi:integrase